VSELDIHDATVDDVAAGEAVADQPEAELADLEAPEADVVEQHRVVGPDAPRFGPDHVPLDADEADVAEQSVDVALDDDDYR
jgi:hypothetical protein